MVFMSIGERIRYVRQLRGLKQEELAIKIGLPANENGRTRISQYENGARVPKQDMLIKISEALDIDSNYLNQNEHTAMLDFAFALFDYDTAFPIDIKKEDEHYYIDFNTEMLNSFFEEWMQKKADLQQGKISEKDYIEWKINYK